MSKKVFFFISGFFLILSLQKTSFAYDDPESKGYKREVVPLSQIQADQEKISQDKKNRNEITVKESQRHLLPQEESTHLQIVPFYSGEEKPVLQKIEKSGTFIYKVNPSPQHNSAGVRGGIFNPVNLKGDVDGITYKNVYGNTNPLFLNFDWEWQFLKFAGKLGLKGNIGFLSAQGNGRFKNNPATQADEIFSLYVVPIGASLVYHAQFWERQILVPFVEGGGDYFGLFETRNDKANLGESLKYGAVPGFHFAGGAQIQLDFLDREGMWQIDQEYGINHIYLTVDMRQIIGLNSIYDFTALYYEGGILFEF